MAGHRGEIPQAADLTLTALPRPCSPDEAVRRASLMVGRPERYNLGSGNYHPTQTADLPWTMGPRGYGCDCSGFICWAFCLPRHRKGFNDGPWATVAHDISTDSMIESAEHPQAVDGLFEVVDRPRVGDLLVYPGIRGPDGKRMRIGHVSIVSKLAPEWDPKDPQYGELEVVQCQASRDPAVKRGPGIGWMFRDVFKSARNEAWGTRILRVVP